MNMWTNKWMILGILLLSSTAIAETASFNNNWRFSKGEQSDAVTQMNFDDSTWQQVRLPHDWAITGPFDPSAHGFSGKLPWSGVGWYRKTFALDAADAGKQIYLDFDGVMAFPEVYINGRLAGKWDYGYMSFRVDATDFVKFGEPNIIAVKADTRNQGTRWYPGAGIYRKVTLSICEPIHVAHWSTYVTTPEVSDITATVNVQTTIENNRSTEETITLDIALINPQGKTVISTQHNMLIPAHESRDIEQVLNIENPERWDVSNPALYTAIVTVSSDDKVLDINRTEFGIRTFKFTADDGFYLNGRRVQLYGVNLHHDQGPLGAAFNVRAMERQLEIMRDMGVNSIRTSHNPPAPELLELCDRMGLLVWDECFDKWDDKAARVNGQPPLEEYGEKQIRNFIMRDRNHPSIVVWSIGNEINNQPGDREGKSPERVAYIRDFVLKYDDTRPVGMACHIPYTATTHILDALDLTGWNYQSRYSDYRERYPDKPIIYSESASTVSSRGFYDPVLPPVKTDYSDGLQVSSYDLNATSWSDIPDIEFDRMEKDNYIAGEMVWTGFDYIGEPTPYDAQARSSYFGIVDLCGIPKDRYYLYRSQWLPNETTVHILPHWNWPDRVGQNVPVFIYTNGDSAELFLNEKSLGRRTKGEIPDKPTNWAQGKSVTFSSELANEGHNAAAVVDADSDTFWCASSRSAEEWIQIDLGESRPIKSFWLEFENVTKNYGYEIAVSTDNQNWKTVVTQAPSREPRWGGVLEAAHATDTQARYVRLTFTDLWNNVRAGIREFGVYSKPVESDYYDATYKYRLRWNEVAYEPGELKAVAYKDGKKIGEAIVRTAGKPAQLRLTPDRTELSASGDDLSYILVEALDADGTSCPLAENRINFEIEGPGKIAGVGNGNPISLEPFQADYRKLFNGKAMLIIRTIENQSGTIRVNASAEGLKTASAELHAER